MTANLIAKVVQSQYDKVSIDELLSELKDIDKHKHGRVSDEWMNKQIENNQYHRWMHSCYLLEEYIKYHFTDFEQTDLVYYWAKYLCERKNELLNKWMGNWSGLTFEEWLIKNNRISRSGRFIS